MVSIHIVQHTGNKNGLMAARTWSKRQFLRGGLAVAGLGAATMPLMTAPVRAAEPNAPKEPSTLKFDLFRKGSHVGVHELQFTPRGDGFVVRNNVDIAVKIAFITAYSFRQEAVDEWWMDADCNEQLLTSSVAASVEDGDKTKFEAAQDGDMLKVAGHDGEKILPIGAMTDLCFWNKDIVAKKQLISTQFGLLANLTVEEPAIERVIANGVLREAERYRMTTDVDRQGTIWYDRRDGSWIKGQLISKGETIEYELAA